MTQYENGTLMKRILVIEDEDNLRENLTEILSFEGYEILQAENGRIGLEMALQHIPDLILCDIMMPEMDGYEVLAALRENPETRLIPFILLTALAEREKMRKGMELGADDYIVKPFGISELLQSVNGRFKKSKAVQDHTEAALNELRINLISQLPHELRTPLNGIIGFGQLLQDNPTSYGPQEVAEFGTTIYKSGQRLYRLIQNYLIYAQLELKNIDACEGEMLEDAGLICRKKAEEIAGRYGRSDDLLVYAGVTRVFAKKDNLEKIVEELVDNAFKFSEQGSRVVVTSQMAANDFKLSVTDHGRGIAQDDIRRIGAYMQFDRMLHAQQGSGLGLIIARRIVGLMKGEFTLESKVDEGTTIHITLPGDALSPESPL